MLFIPFDNEIFYWYSDFYIIKYSSVNSQGMIGMIYRSIFYLTMSRKIYDMQIILFEMVTPNFLLTPIFHLKKCTNNAWNIINYRVNECRCAIQKLVRQEFSICDNLWIYAFLSNLIISYNFIILGKIGSQSHYFFILICLLMGNILV